MNEKSIRDIQIHLIEPATMPEPVSPLMDIMYGAFALIVGLVGGTGLAFLVENLDNRLHTTEQIEAVSGLPILCKIPKTFKSRKSAYRLSNPRFNLGIRSLRTSLLLKDSEVAIKTIMLLSAFPTEGKSTITSNLAISFALAERNVLIIDADMHYPNIHRIFRLKNETGLSNFWESSSDIMEVIQKTDVPGVSALTGGPQIQNSTELLISERMNSLISQLSPKYDHIFFDTPAFLGIPDAATIVPIMDAVILVTKRKTIKKPALIATLQQLRQISVEPIGIVVNHADKIADFRYHKYYNIMKNFDPVEEQKKAEKDYLATRISKENDELEVASKQEDDGELGAILDDEKIKTLANQDIDNLTKIYGISPKIEQVLNSIGITNFAQLSVQESEVLINRLDGDVHIPQTDLDQWIEQAQELSKTTNDPIDPEQTKNQNDVS